ncbi:MAG: hypothetical protein ACR2KU_02475 [Gammaproteobacteria bacterium]
MPDLNREQERRAFASPFEVAYLPVERAGELRADDEHLLAAIQYGDDQPTVSTVPAHIAVPLRSLGRAFIEVWRSHERVTRGQRENVTFCHNEQILMGQMIVAEQDYGDLDTATFAAYRRLYSFARKQGFAHPLRVWNFLPDINGRETRLERYQLFCQGRHRALQTRATTTRQLPAASAIGTQGGHFVIYFIAAREPGAQVENPRQISAFQYPRRYSPKSPSFSRAVVKRWGAGAHLYISGTASIVGHESLHTADTLAQLDETLSNLDALIRHTGSEHTLDIHSVRNLSLLKVYVRDAADCDAIAARLANGAIAEIPVMILHGDICRGDLRVEIEGLYTGQGAAG